LGVFLKQKLENKALTVVGDGEQLRDYVHVSDVANAFIEASHSPKIGRVWNLGSGLGISINRLAEMIGGDIVYIPDRPGEPRITLADISLIKEDLDWSPKISFEDGLIEILKFIDEWKDAPLWTPSSIENATKNWFAVLNKDNLGS
jgi:UDP-glucose 4-epimerase